MDYFSYYIGKFITETETNKRYLITGIDYINDCYILDNSPLKVRIDSLHIFYKVDKINNKRMYPF